MRRVATMMFFVLLLPGISRSQIQIENAFPQLGFTRPLSLQHAHDASGRLFVVEQAGVIRVFENRPSVESSAVFLDIRARVDDGGNEEGLLGLAFHPSYGENGYFYVNYTAASPNRTVVSRFRVSATDADVADPESEVVLLEFPQPYSNHNGGHLAFGPDGYLYIATGDGGNGGDPQNNAQNRQNLLGCILRIDVDRTDGNNTYGIPADNPFAGNNAGFREEIWAYGLRNPWRFSFDALTGELWAGDVGQNRFEEIDIIEGGGNYGWRIMEAFSCFNPSSGCDQTGLELPVWSYPRSEGTSVTGGYVYRGSRVPELKGLYVYADFVSGTVWGLTFDGGNATNQQLLTSGKNIASFGVDENEELYICSFDGSIYRFTSPATSASRPGAVTSPDVSSVYPNPVHAGGVSTVRVTLTERTRVQAILYDVLGRPRSTIADTVFPEGVQSLTIPARSLAPGVYLLGVSTTSGTSTRRVIVR